MLVGDVLAILLLLQLLEVVGFGELRSESLIVFILALIFLQPLGSRNRSTILVLLKPVCIDDIVLGSMSLQGKSLLR